MFDESLGGQSTLAQSTRSELCYIKMRWANEHETDKKKRSLITKERNPKQSVHQVHYENDG